MREYVITKQYYGCDEEEIFDGNIYDVVKEFIFYEHMYEEYIIKYSDIEYLSESNKCACLSLQEIIYDDCGDIYDVNVIKEFWYIERY